LISLLDSSPKVIKGVGSKYFEILDKNRYSTVYDLLTHFPKYYIDTSLIDNIVEIGVDKVYNLEIKKSGLYRNYKRRLSIINISGFVGETTVDIAIFNKPYLMEQIKSSKTIKIYGKILMYGIQHRMENPKILNDKGGIIPVYDNVGTISGGTIGNIIKNIFDIREEHDDILPKHLVKKYNFMPFWESLKRIHVPEHQNNDIKTLKERFIYSEFLYFQIESIYIRKKSGKSKRSRNYKNITDSGKNISSRINFQLTEDQKKAIRDIQSDLTSNFTMQRLLLGDVGSGKTIISFLFLLIAVCNNYQGAFLAPTEVLTDQHFENASHFFKDIKIAILTGSTSRSEKRKITEELKSGKIQIIFGTHSIINDGIKFKNLSAIVIDEQHRFGVAQRASLFYKGENADLLVTTATPIPRTLLLSLYKDLDVSEIKSMPKDRIPIRTLILKQEVREKFYAEILNRVKNGEKAFIVLPLILQSSRFKELRSLEGEKPFFKNMFGDTPFGIISGKTPTEEKQRTFEKFKDGKINILISTTIIEVGIDIRDATIIIIEDADKYGLSQLHQLRGRVGRGNKKSFCYLFPSLRITRTGQERLKIIKEISDGFEIAEKDLGMRGGGDILGTEQSGYLDFHISDIKEYPDLYRKASKDALHMIKDPIIQNIHIANKLAQIDKRIKKISFS